LPSWFRRVTIEGAGRVGHFGTVVIAVVALIGQKGPQ